MSPDVTDRGGSGGASPPAFTRTTITSKSPSEAVFIKFWVVSPNGGERGAGEEEKKEEKGEGKEGKKGRRRSRLPTHQSNV